MSEWSKEPDLRPGSISCVGSNPTSCNYITLPLWLSWLERAAVNREVIGSIPIGGEYTVLISQFDRDRIITIIPRGLTVRM